MENLFRKQSMDSLSSPDQLNSYIKATSVPVWIILGAIIAFAAGLIAWGVFGSVVTSTDIPIYIKNGEAVCFIENSDELSEGMSVTSENFTGEVVMVSDTPISKADAAELLKDDYAVYVLSPAEWSFPVIISAKDAADGVQNATVIEKSEKPISFLLN